MNIPTERTMHDTPKLDVRPASRAYLRSRAFRDGFVIVGLTLLVFVLSDRFELSQLFMRWILSHTIAKLDVFLTVAIFLIGASAIFTWRRRNELLEQLERRERAEAEVKTLSGLLPICAWCKKIRDDRGYWNQIESYIQLHSEAEFTHGICPECASRIHTDHHNS